jgi:hypothetical protein
MIATWSASASASSTDQLDHAAHRPGRRVVAGVALEHLAHGQKRLDRKLLQDDPQLAAQPLPGSAITGVDPQHANLTGVPFAESLQDLDRGRLARPVRAEQRKHLPGLDLEAHPVDGADFPVGPNQSTNAHCRHNSSPRN